MFFLRTESLVSAMAVEVERMTHPGPMHSWETAAENWLPIVQPAVSSLRGVNLYPYPQPEGADVLGRVDHGSINHV